jgi:hypothetical protein
LLGNYKYNTRASKNLQRLLGNDGFIPLRYGFGVSFEVVIPVLSRCLLCGKDEKTVTGIHGPS